MALAITTTSFRANQKIPERFSRDGGNVSPQVQWHGAPAQTRSFALIVEDPDAPRGTFRHWVAYDIPAVWQQLPEGAGSQRMRGAAGAAMRMAKNDFGNPAYDGPQPPRGHGTHHYHFRLFALDVPKLDLPDDCGAHEVLEAARSHRLAESETVGVFER